MAKFRVALKTRIIPPRYNALFWVSISLNLVLIGYLVSKHHKEILAFFKG